MAERYTICRILVAIKDPYARSFPAVIKAVQLAQACNARIELFHAIDLRLDSEPYDSCERVLGDDLESIRARYLQQLEVIAASSRRHGIDIAVAAEWDHPGYEAILRRAAIDSTDLIIAERHGEHEHASHRLHPTDRHLLRDSPIPILLVKRGEAYRRPLVLVAIALRPTHATTQLDKHILSIANALAGALHGRVQVVARRVADMTRRLDSSIVVLGTVPRAGLRGALFGDTAERALRVLDCDLLVVKPEHTVARVAARVRGAYLIPEPSVIPVALAPLA